MRSSVRHWIRLENGNWINMRIVSDVNINTPTNHMMLIFSGWHSENQPLTIFSGRDQEKIRAYLMSKEFFQGED